MKHWYDYQIKNQVINFDWQDATRPIANVNKEFAPFINELKARHCRGELIKESQTFFGEEYLSDIKDPALDPENIKKLFFHPDFETVTKNSDIDQVRVPADIGAELAPICSKIFNLRLDSVFLGIQLQHPGQYIMFHIDRPKYHDYGLKHTDMHQEPPYRKILIFCDDWQDGQCFQMGKEFIKWKAGDVFTWHPRDVPHGTANFGFEPRWILRVSGIMLE